MANIEIDSSEFSAIQDQVSYAENVETVRRLRAWLEARLTERGGTKAAGLFEFSYAPGLKIRIRLVPPEEATVQALLEEAKLKAKQKIDSGAATG